MSIADQITRLQTAKQNIKTATANKGVNIPNDKLISDYDDYIDQIQTGTSLVVNSNNLDYFCSDRPDFIPVLDDTEVLTYFEYGGTTYNFDIDMHGCFLGADIMAQNHDPIKLVNKIINLNDKYANIQLARAFYNSGFNYDFGQDSTIYIKSAPHTREINMQEAFVQSRIYNFKDITIDFTGVDTTYTTELNVMDMIGGANTSSKGFKIINLPVSILYDDYGDGCDLAYTYHQYTPTIKQFTSDGSQLNVDLFLQGVIMSEAVFMEFINSLAVNTSGSVRIKITSTLYNSLTSDDLAAVAAKNYTLSH